VILLAILLLVNAAFNALVWPTFYQRIAHDERAHDADGKATRFLVVHTVLIGAALVIAAVSAVAAILCLIRM
jgi:uncharacterized membrane protein